MRPFAVLAVGLLLAGCADPARETPSGASGASEEGLDVQPVSNATSLSPKPGSHGGIRGLVVDERYRPVTNVTVHITPENTTVLTGQDGAFAFDGVAPGSHWVRVISKDTLVYARAIEVVAGETTQVVLQLQGPSLAATRVDIAAKEFAFTPADSRVAHAQIPFMVHLTNGGIAPHTVHFAIVCDCPGGSRQLWESSLDVDAGGSADLHVPIEPDGWPNVAVKTGSGWGSFEAKAIHVDLEDVLFGPLGMAGRISLAE